MKMKFGALLLTAVVFLAGCSGFWKIPPLSSSGGTTTTPTTLSSGVFYVLNQKAMQIAAYSIASGSLVQISGSPYTLSAAPYCIAVAPSGGFLYVGTVSGIYLYSVQSGGGLTIGNNGTPVSSDIPAAMQVNGAWLIDAFVPNSGQVQFNAIPINALTGAYAGVGGAPPYQVFSVVNATVNQMALSPDGTNLFAALGAGGTMVMPFNAGSSIPFGATARLIAVDNSNGSSLAVAVDPTNRLFYVGETLASSDSGGLRVFNYSSLGTGIPRAIPTEITGSPFASGGLAPNAVFPAASGDYVYVANGQGTSGAGNIAWFPISVSGTNYSIAAGSTIAAGIEPVSLAEDSNDSFLLAVSNGGSTTSGDPDLEAYTMSSGALTAAITTSTGIDPVGAVAVAALP